MPTRSYSSALFGQLCGLSLAKPISQMRKLTSIAVEWQPSHTDREQLSPDVWIRSLCGHGAQERL